MEGYKNIDEFNNDEIDLRELFVVLWNKKKFISISTLASTLIFLVFSIFLPNIYTSSALLVPVSQKSDISQVMGGYGELANIAGLELPSNADTLTMEGIKTMASLHFFESRFLPRIFLPDLMAIKSWDHRSNELTYKKNIYDIESNQWIRKVSFPLKTIPSAQESFQEFNKKHLTIFEDKETGFVEVSIDHKSPYIAHQWLSILVEEINSSLRGIQKEKSLKSVEYLNDQIIQTQFSEVKLALSTLWQEETGKLMVIEASDDYVFKILDPPFIPERKSKPDRPIILFIGFIFGIILSAFIVLARYFFSERS